MYRSNGCFGQPILGVYRVEHVVIGPTNNAYAYKVFVREHCAAMVLREPIPMLQRCAQNGGSYWAFFSEPAKIKLVVAISMPADPSLLRAVFELTLEEFFVHETHEVLEGVNERNNCGRMAIYMQRIAEAHGLHGYFADMEYNRNQDGRVKTILDREMKVVTINCDLILHSRGGNIAADNLIAVEVKKRDGREEDKTKDRERLRALTKASYDEIWSHDGVVFPEHVCGYCLGVYVELDRQNRQCSLEYYSAGNKFEERVRAF